MLAYILRHGQAARADPGGADELRPLTARGAEQADEIGRRLAVASPRPEIVLTSDAARALATARRVAAVANLPDPRVEPLLRLGREAGEALVLFAEHERCTAVLLVGHNPQLSDLAEILCGVATDDLRTGECVLVQSDPGRRPAGTWLARWRLAGAPGD